MPTLLLGQTTLGSLSRLFTNTTVLTRLPTDVAHDVGCGTGRVVAAAELVLYYPHVIALDADADY